MNVPRQAVILCGGLGTRLRPYTDTLPKPMIPVNGRPFLEYLVEQLREQGIERIVLLTGYRAQQIEDHFGGGHDFGVGISISRGPVEWDTGRRLWEARHLLDGRFLLLYSDNFARLNLPKLWAFHAAAGCPVTVTLAAKAEGNIRLGASGVIERYDATRLGKGLGHVEIGYMVVERDPVLALIQPVDISFSHVLDRLAAQGALAGTVSGDGYHSISDPKRWKLAEDYLRIKRILLLDRDGTLNVRPPKAQYLTRWEDFRWSAGALEGLTALAQRGFRFALISNQAGIERGLVTQAQVDALTDRLTDELAARGITLLKAYICPHHWDTGCDCRKPAPGLFFQACRELTLRLDRTLYVGDDPRDCQAAANAECSSVFIGPAAEVANLPPRERPAHVADTLNEAVPWILSKFEAWENGPMQMTLSRFSDLRTVVAGGR